MAIGINITVNSLCVFHLRSCHSIDHWIHLMMSPIIFLHEIFLLVTHGTPMFTFCCVFFLRSFVRFLYFNFYLPLANDDGRVQAHTQRIFKMFQFQRKHELNYKKFLDNLRVVDVENYMQLLCLWTFWFMFIYFCVGNFFVSRTHKNYDYVLRFWHLTSLNFEQREKHNYDDNTCTHIQTCKREKYTFFHIVSIEMRCRSLVLSLSHTLCVSILCRRELESSTHRSVLCVCVTVSVWLSHRRERERTAVAIFVSV